MISDSCPPIRMNRDSGLTTIEPFHPAETARASPECIEGINFDPNRVEGDMHRLRQAQADFRASPTVDVLFPVSFTHGRHLKRPCVFIEAAMILPPVEANEATGTAASGFQRIVINMLVCKNRAILVAIELK